jgi:hypothetical protein
VRTYTAVPGASRRAGRTVCRAPRGAMKDDADAGPPASSRRRGTDGGAGRVVRAEGVVVVNGPPRGCGCGAPLFLASVEGWRGLLAAAA